MEIEYKLVENLFREKEALKTFIKEQKLMGEYSVWKEKFYHLKGWGWD